MGDVAVIVPTLRRPESLERALRSLMAQTGVADRLSAIVVVDNDPAGSAQGAVQDLMRGVPFPIVYRHAPRPGVATARNAGLAATDAPLIAFLDDDEAAASTWLSALLAAQAQTGADVVFGPIRGCVPEGTGWARAYLERFFGRDGPAETGLTAQSWGCGNSLMVRATALPGPAPFDTSADHAGGEDDALFAALRARGGRFGWAADAWVDEHAPAHRATLRYALTRAFAYGQGPSQTAAAAGNWPVVARWMLIGAAQAGIWSVVALARAIALRPSAADALDKAARGIGKVLWFKGFEPHFYGANEIRRLDRKAV